MIKGLAVCLICAASLFLVACGGGSPAGPTAAPIDTVPTLAPVPGTVVSTPDGPDEGLADRPLAVVALSVQPATVAVGEVADVLMSVDDVVDLYGAEIHLRFDPALLEVVDASGSTDGVRLEAGGFLKVGFTVINAVDNAAGSTSYAVTQMPPSRAVTGSGNLLWFSVRAKAPGTTALQVESLILASAMGEAIPLTVDAAGATLVIQ